MVGSVGMSVKEELFADMMVVEWFDDYTTRYRRKQMQVKNPF